MLKIQPVKFELPPLKSDFREIKERMANFSESYIVNDSKDARDLVRTNHVIEECRDELIAKLKPQLENMIKQS